MTCVVADDNDAILAALASLLSDEGIEILGKARSGEEAVQLVEREQPATLVVDVRLPDFDGVEVARRVGELARPRPAVILYTSYADGCLVGRALDVGARGVVLKDAPPQNLLDAIAFVAGGGTYIDPRLRRGPRRAP